MFPSPSCVVFVMWIDCYTLYFTICEKIWKHQKGNPSVSFLVEYTILMIDGGTAADYDTHENLVRKTDSLYCKLFRSQAENDRTEDCRC